MSEQTDPISRTYRFVMAACSPVTRWWGRLAATGTEALPATGPVLLVGNHDSLWDPVVIGTAGADRRQIRALAKASLWKITPLAPVLDRMGQVPIERGAGDAGALDAAVEQLRAGACIGVFPEGTISRGEELRPRSGVGRLAQLVPEARIVCVATIGTVDIFRFPKRPRLTVEFFDPEGGQPRPDESPADLSTRLLAEIRERAPIAQAGRRSPRHLSR
jgi:1-acyl-sn-glycerol-3-phosphate acyltransferase